jgi:prephenate dehydratase
LNAIPSKLRNKMDQRNHKTRVAFQGERGAFSEDAAIQLLGEDIELVPRSTFSELYSTFKEGVADLLLAPVENSVAGVVQPSVELLRESELIVIDQITISIQQNLIACPGVSFSELLEVQSHPMALAQCTRFFVQYPQLKQVVSADTAGSVAEVMGKGDPRRAAIAGKRAAEIYGGVVIRENIQDTSDNFTRFVLLANSN